MYNLVIFGLAVLGVLNTVYLYILHVSLRERVKTLERQRETDNTTIKSLVDKQIATSKALESVMQQQRRQAKTRYEPTRNNNDRSQVRTRQRK